MSDPGTGALVNRLANPPNPFEQFGQTVNALTAARQYRAQEAVGEIYNRNIDPTTGQLNMGAFNADVARDPDARMFAGPTMQKAGEAVGAQGVGRAQDVAGIMAGVEARQASMSPLYAQAQLAVQGKGPPVTGAQVMEAAKNMPKLSPDMQANLDRQLAEIGPNGDASNLVIGGYYANQHTREMLQAQMPSYGAFSTGGVVTPTQVNPRAGGVSYPTPGAPLALTPSPGEQIQPVNIPLPGGNTAQMPQGVFAQGPTAQRLWLQQNYPEVYGAPPANAPPVTAGPAVARPSPAGVVPGARPAEPPAPPGGAGAAPAAAAATSASEQPSWAQPPPPPKPGPGAGSVGITPSPGYGQAQTATATASTAAANTLQGQVAATRDTLPLLNGMESLLASGKLITGAGIDTVNNLRQLMIRAGLAPAQPGKGFNAADPAAIQEEFNKLAAQLETAQLKALGNPSDSRQELAIASTPGKLLTTHGNEGIIAQLKGNQYALRAQGNAWDTAQQKGWDPSRFNEWQNERFLTTDKATGGRFDTQAFWLATRSPTEQRKFAGQMTQDQLKQFTKNVGYAQKQGWIAKNSDGTFSVASP
jgi:hypothetical protein